MKSRPRANPVARRACRRSHGGRPAVCRPGAVRRRGRWPPSPPPARPQPAQLPGSVMVGPLSGCCRWPARICAMDCSNAQGHHPGARSSSGPGARGSARHPPGAGRSQAAIGAHAVALSHPRGGLPLRSAPGRGAPIGAALARSAYLGGPGAERLFGRPRRGAPIWAPLARSAHLVHNSADGRSR
jgi:hypothetical protein